MTTQSAIEWTEQTWNPITGCTKISPGCKHCYADTMARRLQAMGVHGYENGFGLTLLPERLVEPLKRKKPTVYFVNSMSDLFHEDVPDAFIQQVFDVIRQTPQHTYQILTNGLTDSRNSSASMRRRRTHDSAYQSRTENTDCRESIHSVRSQRKFGFCP